MTRAIGMCSGGLDSLLAIRVVQEMGIEAIALHCVIGFEALPLRRRIAEFDSRLHLPAEVERIAVQHELLDLRLEFLQVLARPVHGFGANLNPCIDCKILMLSRAQALMQQMDAAFVFTGEVLDQRPMSQRRQTLELIAERAASAITWSGRCAASISRPPGRNRPGCCGAINCWICTAADASAKWSLPRNWACRHTRRPPAGVC